MTFATQQDLVDRFGELELIQLTDRVNKPASVIDAVPIARALADADAIAVGYLSKLYTLPLPATPPVLTKVCADLARFYLHGDRVQKDSPIAANHAAALAWLKDVAKGVVALDLGGDDTGTTAPQTGGSSVRAKTADRVFTRDSLGPM